jgi:hypothetical protein
MAYFPASCDYDCKDCSQNKCGWCAFHDHPCGATLAETIEPYNYSTTITLENKEDKK